MRSPTLSTIEAKVAELKACKNKEYTYEEVQKLVEGERKSNKMKGNFALRKIELRTQIEHMQEKAAEWALHVSNFKDGQEEGPSSVDPDKTPVPFTPEQIAAALFWLGSEPEALSLAKSHTMLDLQPLYQERVAAAATTS
jgi:hypothetical protein